MSHVHSAKIRGNGRCFQFLVKDRLATIEVRLKVVILNVAILPRPLVKKKRRSNRYLILAQKRG